MEETAPLKRTQNERQKQKSMYMYNAVLYNMLLHHDVVRVQVPFFSTTTTTSSTTLLIILFFDFNGERVPAVVIQPSEVPDGGGAFRLGVVRSVDGFDENFDLVPGFEF